MFDELRGPGLEVFYFEDYSDVHWRVDGIINGCLDSERIEYKAPTLLLGIEHLALSIEYSNLPPARIERDVGRILVTLGGIDHYDLSSRIINLVSELGYPIGLDLIVGPYFENMTQIRQAVNNWKGSSSIVLHDSPSSLLPIMQKCDIAISAGGITLYELAAVGVPTIGIALWENQEHNVASLGKRGVLLPINYQIANHFETALENDLVRLISGYDLRLNMARMGQTTIDGKGASRIAEKLLSPLRASSLDDD